MQISRCACSTCFISTIFYSHFHDWSKKWHTRNGVQILELIMSHLLPHWPITTITSRTVHTVWVKSLRNWQQLQLLPHPLWPFPSAMNNCLTKVS